MLAETILPRKFTTVLIKNYLCIIVFLNRKSLDLVEVLLRLSEVGHYQPVSELFKFPVQNCPDMLVLALLQITVSGRLFCNSTQLLFRSDPVVNMKGAL